MSLLPGIEQRYLNPQTGPLDTLLPDAGVRAIPSVLIFNTGDVNSVTVRCQGGQTINGVATYTIGPRVSVLFVSDGVAWRTHDGGGASNNLSLGARANRNSAQSIGNFAFTPVVFQGLRYDTDQLFSASLPAQFTIRTAGKYGIGGSVEWATAAGNIRILDIRLNGVTIIARQAVAPIGGGLATGMEVSTIYDLIVGDFLELVVLQDSGAPLGLTSSGNYTPEFWVHRLGDQASSGVSTSRRINTSAPLTGGGSLAADLTLDIALATTVVDGSVILAADGGVVVGTVVQGNDSRLADPRPMAYAPGSFTIPTGKYAAMVKELILAGTDRGTLAGTARLTITD